MSKPSSFVFALVVLSLSAAGCAEQKGRKKDEKADNKADNKAKDKTKANESKANDKGSKDK